MTDAARGQTTGVTAVLPEQRASEAPAAEERRRVSTVGWVLAAVAVLTLLVALASPVFAPAASAGTLVSAMFVLALSLGGLALTYLLPARRRR